MSKVTLNDIASLTNEQSFISTTNDNYQTIEEAFDNTLSLDGTSPNSMGADLDMDGNRIMNLPAATGAGQPVRYDEFLEGGVVGPAGPTGATGPAGANGTNGTDGASSGFIQTYSTTTTDSDPGAGTFRFNNATPASATAAYLDNEDASANTISTFLDLWDDSTNTTKGYVQFVKVGSPGTWARFKMTGSVVDGTGYRKLTLTAGVGSGAFTNGNSFSITFYPAGDKGADGAGTGDVVGPASATDNAVVRFDSTTGKLVQDSAVTIADTTGLVTGATFPNTGLKVLDTNASHLLTIAPGSDLSADRTLTVTTGDAARTVTLSGNPTLSDWFDQSVKAAASPEFAEINVGHATDTTITRTGAGDIAVEGNAVYRAGGTDVPISDGGTGASTAANAATNLGLGTGDSPQFTAVNLGHATDTTVSKSSAGIIAVEGVPLYSQIPQNSQSAAYTTVLADAQKHILHPTADNNARTFTIDSNASVAYPIGTCITFINQINTVTIAINSDTLTLAGAGTTGSRTLASNGIATAIKVGTTSWLISGTGLT